MSADWITPPNFDHHAEAIDGPLSDPWTATVPPSVDDVTPKTRRNISDKTAWKLADLSGIVILIIAIGIGAVVAAGWQAGVLP